MIIAYLCIIAVNVTNFIMLINMALPFEHVEHKVYKNTFLQSVFVDLQFSYSDDYQDDRYKSHFEEFLSKYFAITLNEYQPDKFIHIRNNTNKSEIIFGSNHAISMIPHDGYVSFEESAQPQARKLRLFIEEVPERKVVDKLSIRKINAWQLNDVPDKPDFDKEIFNQFFTSNFITSKTTADLDKNEEKIPNIKKYFFSDKDISITIRTALVPLNDSKKTLNLILDTEATMESALPIETKQIATCLANLNDVLFNAFHWCVNKEIISLMDK